jgi:hypothetical protein
MAKEYWHCFIGPIDRSKLPHGCDAPMRIAVENAYEKLTDSEADTHSSGWGVTEEEYNILTTVSSKLKYDSVFAQKLKAILDNHTEDDK